MPTKLDFFLNGNPNGKTDKERNGRKVTEKDKPFTLWSFENKHKWFIDDDDREEFLKLYCADIRCCVPRYFTERSTPIGQMRVDLDFKYAGIVEEHKHTQDQVVAFAGAYMEAVKRYVEVPESVEIYVLEKEYPTYDGGKNVSASGIHLQVPAIKTRASVEESVKRALVHRMEEFFPNLGCMQPWDTIYDKQPLSHTNNWPLLGSKKPFEGSLPYEIKYVIHYDTTTGAMRVDDTAEPTPTIDLVRKLSIRSPESDETPLTEYGKANCRSPTKEAVARVVVRGRSGPDVPDSRSSSPGRIYIAPLSDIQKNYIRDHVMNLSETRYTDYAEWISVGQCLRNIHPELEDVWLDFSAQYEKYNETEAHSKWNSFTFRVDGQRLQIGSLRLWSKTDNYDRFAKIEAGNVDRLADNAAQSATEYDVALVVYAQYRDEFKCANYKNNEWFQYCRHIWRNTENGVTLQLRLSADIAKIFLDKEQEELNKIASNGQCTHKDIDPSCPTCQSEVKKKQYSTIRLKLKTTKFKDNVMKECRALFFDKDFAIKLDENKHLIAFNNGVFDTLNLTFREGRPDDCISLCTNTDYQIDTQYYKYDCWPELKKFIESILPNRNVREYFFKHLSRCLSGIYTQDFHIMTGCGSNGKSMLMNLMSTAFGEYGYKVNIALFTQKRGKAGAAAPEMVRMKGRRFVMMSEPDQEDTLSEGFLKEITGSEKMTVRDLYGGSKQMLELDVQAKFYMACNVKPRVNDTTDGTWRRLKVIDFPSKFVHEPRTANEYPIDESIMQKVLSPEWAECFMSYLVHVYTEGKGHHKLNAPDEVKAYTNEYKEDSDAIAKFMTEYFHPGTQSNPGEAPEPVQWTTVMATFHEWKRSNEVTKGSVQELRKRVEAQFGKLPKSGWTSFYFGTDT